MEKKHSSSEYFFDKSGGGGTMSSPGKKYSTPFDEDPEGVSGAAFELKEVIRPVGSPKPQVRASPSIEEDSFRNGDFDLQLEDDPLPLHFERDAHVHEEEEEEERDGNDDFDVITIEEGRHSNGLGHSTTPMTPEQEAKYRNWVRWAIIVSWISVVIDLAFGFIALYIAVADKSVGIFGFSLENFLDVVTSLLIIWRFGGFSRSELVVGDPEHDEKMERREQRAEVMIAMLFVLLGGLTCVIALIVLYEKESPDDVVSVMIIAGVSIVVLALLAVAKFRLSIALHSQAFRQDAWVTTISCILSIGLLVGSIVYHVNNDIWYIDCLVALPLGGTLVAYGLKTLFTRKWWQAHFWGYYVSNVPIN